MKKLLLVIGTALFFSCNNSPSTNKGFVAKSVLLPSGNSGEVLENKDTLEFKDSKKDTTVNIAYTYAIKKTDTIRHKLRIVKDTVVVTPPPPPVSGYTTVYTNNFNLKSDVNANQLGNGSYVTSPSFDGLGSFKSIVKYGDVSISQGYRSEQQFDGSLYAPLEGAYDYYAMWTEFDHPGWGGSGGIQLHPGGNDNGGSALFFVETAQQKINIYIWRKGYQDSYQACMPIDLNHWYHFRIEYKWSQKTDGYFIVYVDESKYWSFTNGYTQYYDPVKKVFSNDIPYPKLGQNNFANQPTTSPAPHGQTIFFDKFFIQKKN